PKKPRRSRDFRIPPSTFRIPMNPAWTFTFGLVLLILFGWYFATESGRRKRILGSVLAVLLVAFCLQSVNPPGKKIHLGLDLQGGTSFLIRLDPPVGENGERRTITHDMVEQAMEAIRKRIDTF